MEAATMYVVAWCAAGLAGVALIAVTARVLITFGERREWPWNPRYLLALIIYPGVIVYFAVDQVRSALAEPKTVTTVHLMLPALALIVAVGLGFAEWRYVRSNSPGRV